MGWVSSYRRHLGFFSLEMLGFLLIGDDFFWDRRHLGSHRDAWVDKLRRRFGGESESDLFGSIFFVWVLFF